VDELSDDDDDDDGRRLTDATTVHCSVDQGSLSLAKCVLPSGLRSKPELIITCATSFVSAA